MPAQELFRVVFLRHGHTKYTNIQPDITVPGRIALDRTCSSIKTFADGRSVHLLTSPAVRAVGSGEHINRLLPAVSQAEEPSLAAVKLLQPETAKCLFAKHISSSDNYAVEKAYWACDEFNNPAVFEPKAQIRARLFRFISDLINRHASADTKPCYICVSHVEVLCHLIDRPFGYDFSTVTPVKCAEPIFIVVNRRAGNIRLVVKFRQRICQVTYDLTKPTNPY